ncbi:MAG: carbohydrate-binding domain-containing protein [Lachnospiraceae bacterium]|nr:carbohydrate-binding domain-containing protein [Lachnospiraceae bacterium]
MKKRLAALSICFVAVFFTACTQNGSTVSGDEAASDNGAVSAQDAGCESSAPEGVTQVEHIDTTTEDGSVAGIDLSDRVYSLSFPAYSENYDYYGYKDEKATYIEMSGNTAKVTGDDADDVSVSDGLIKIGGKGTYVLSGDFEGQIYAETEDKNVRLVLNGVDITSPDGPAIWTVGAKNLYITMADGTENSISDSDKYSTSEASAAISADCDMVINGGGKLRVCGNYSRAIHTKDDLILRSGSLDITAVGDAVKGKDSIKVYSGTYTINAGGKGLVVTEKEDEEKGYFYVEGGTIGITAGDDGIHCNCDVMIVGGEVDINAGDDGIHADKVVLLYDTDVNVANCKEGIEGTVIDMVGSVVNVNSSDDGLNAAGDTEESEDDGDEAPWDFMAGNEGNVIYLDGSNVYVNASGDGLDSNGYIYLTGGNVVVDGPENSGNGFFDYGVDFIMTGGTLIGAGSSGMMQTISESSTVTCIAVAAAASDDGSDDNSESSHDGPGRHDEGSAEAGTGIVIKDSAGNEAVSFYPAKSYSAIVFAGFGFESGETYTAESRNSAAANLDGTDLGSVTIEGIVNYIGDLQTFGAPGGGPGGGPDFGTPPDFDGEWPEGEQPDFGTPPDGERPDFDGEWPEGEKSDFDGERPDMPETD